jgi:catechol 2,3-dioxygenase-like lactoylglutathione lyase family enzyme
VQGIVFLPTQDLLATHRFYADVLGLPLARDQGVCRIYRVDAHAFFGFCTSLQPMADPSRAILTIVRDDVEQTYDLVVARGIFPEGPVKHNPQFGITHFFVRDPNGYRVEIQRFDVPLV